MTETSDLAGSGEVIEGLGQAWSLSHLTPGIRGTYSQWLKGRARQGLRDERQAGTLSVTEYDEEASRLKRQLDAGSYNWGSPFHPEAMGDAIAASLGGLDGKIKLLQLLLASAHGAVPPERVVELLEAAGAGVPEGEESPLALAIKICLDPNRAGPVRVKLALILEAMRRLAALQTMPMTATPPA